MDLVLSNFNTLACLPPYCVWLRNLSLSCLNVHHFSNFQLSSVALFPCGCTSKGQAGSLRPQGTCYSFSLVFICSPLCSVVYTSPHHSFICFPSLSFYLSFVSQFLCYLVKSQCLFRHHLLIPGLFHDFGSSSESHYFNAGESLVV